MSDQLHSGLHPDADVLNAFLEGALPEHERVACLTHLAECAPCREVVSLAGQAGAVDDPVAAPPPKVSVWQRLFRPLPVLAAFVATVVVLFSIGLYRMIRSAEPKPQQTASVSTPAENAPALAEATQPAPEPAKPPVAKAKPRAVPPPEPQQPQIIAAAPPPAPAPAATPAAAPLAASARFSPPALPEVVGTVTDRAGSSIANAQVELKNAQTGSAVASTSNARGEFTIAGLAPGKYDLSITAPGFKRFEKPLVDVQSQQIARLDSTLDVGTATETVAVTAEAPLLKTESGTISDRVSGLSAGSLPLLAAPRAVPPIPPVYTLPDNSRPVSFAVKGKTVVAADAAGALFLSNDEGKTWDRIKGKWKGKVVRVTGAANDFQLIAEPAATWTSADGRKWSKLR